jgi:hypothetical protein
MPDKGATMSMQEKQSQKVIVLLYYYLLRLLFLHAHREASVLAGELPG